MSEYRVDIKVRNNVILRKIEQAGYKTLGEFCRLNNIMKYVARLGEVINMKYSPLDYKGEFHPFIEKISELLNCSPLDLFTDTQLHTILQSNKRSVAVNEAEMKFMIQQDNSHKLLEDIIDAGTRDNKIKNVLKSLTPREEKILKMRFGLDDGHCHTLAECGEHFGVHAQRIRQIEVKALRKLRHPSRSNELREFVNL